MITLTKEWLIKGSFPFLPLLNRAAGVSNTTTHRSPIGKHYVVRDWWSSVRILGSSFFYQYVGFAWRCMRLARCFAACSLAACARMALCTVAFRRVYAPSAVFFFHWRSFVCWRMHSLPRFFFHWRLFVCWRVIFLRLALTVRSAGPTVRLPGCSIKLSRSSCTPYTGPYCLALLILHLFI